MDKYQKENWEKIARHLEKVGATDNDYYIRAKAITCLLYTSPSPRDATLSRMPSSA